MQFVFNYWSSYDRGFNSPQPLADNKINANDHVVNVDSSETSNLDNMTNEVPSQYVNDANKKK